MRCSICNIFLYNVLAGDECTQTPQEHIHAAACYRMEDTELAICHTCNREPALRNRYWKRVGEARQATPSHRQPAAIS